MLTVRGPSVRLAVDDAGAGFASFRHVLQLNPAFVKLDRSLVAGIDSDPAKQALVAGMRQFARATRCRLIAEGVETEAERAALAGLGVRLAQGYLLGRPGPLPD
jgi:EAL domain-containing protein (putative c-di-GMP-specific phosphodiesterase class I)